MKLSSSDTSAVNAKSFRKFLLPISFLVVFGASLSGNAKSADSFQNFLQQTGRVDSQAQGLTHYFILSETPAFDKRISLLTFNEHKDQDLVVGESYNRAKHFGTWIQDQTSGHCMNTRGEVLTRESETPVKMNDKGCTVVSGTWYDPYTGDTVYKAADLQIDHVVPLKNAYIGGAGKWDKKRRCLYANFKFNNFHLVAVSGKENGLKGDRGPDGYIPPNREYACQYLHDFLFIKLIWNIALSANEQQAAEEAANDYKCGTQMSVTATELKKQRELVSDNADLCDNAVTWAH